MKTQDDLRFDARSVLVTPSSRQLAWQRTEFYAFVHFSVNTFTNREWGDGTEPPSCFAPARLDTDQWARCIRDAAGPAGTQTTPSPTAPAPGTWWGNFPIPAAGMG